jgi:hypothetical protein
VVNGEEGYGEACQEEEDRDVEKGRDGLDGDADSEALRTLGEEGADVGTLMNSERGLHQLEVSASPALLERCEQSTEKRYDEAQKPERVYPNGGGGWRWPSRSGREGS